MKRNKLDVSKEKLEIKPLCPTELSKIYTTEGALSRDFQIATLSSCRKFHVHVRAYVDFYGGYAEHGRKTIFDLQKSGQCEVKLTPIKSLIDIDPPTMGKCTWFVTNPGFRIKDSVFLTIAGPGWAQNKFQPKDDRYKVAWTMIESRDCHPEIKNWLQNVDEVWVPTDVDVKRFSRLGLKKIIKMKLCCDHKLFNPNVMPISISNLEGRFVFGVLGSWNKRKGIKKIIRAFCMAFSPEENVSLLLVCKYGTRPYNGFKDDEKVLADEKEKWNIEYEFKKYTKEFKKIPHIALIDIPLHENMIPHIMARFNVLVGFSMGESTWLPGLQAAMMKKPIIQMKSKCSGFTDYLNDKNSYLVENSGFQKADDELVRGTSGYYSGQDFSFGREEELAKMMQKVYTERESKDLKLKVERAYNSVITSHSDNVPDIIRRLKEIKDAKNL